MHAALPPLLDLRGKRVLIFVVAYNAEKTIQSVLTRIPAALHQPGVEVLVIDDFSQDATFDSGLSHARELAPKLRVNMLRTPSNQGYGGNQKLGYQYAIDQQFDIVALVHGDGQYAPEKLPDLLEPLLNDEADAVFGSRMLRRADALRGGMPLYKWVGNQVLTGIQNRLLGTRLSEFHSGYRLYSVEALRRVPFQRNSNDFHFDTEIIIQFVMGKLRIRELPIPTYYGDEICHVNGLKYALDVCRATVRSRFHERNLLYDRKFDVLPPEETYDVKLGYASSHTAAIDAAKPGGRILDIGCGRGFVARELAKTAAHVTGVDMYPPKENIPGNAEFHRCNLDHRELPVDVADYDQIYLLDIIEHLRDPEQFMEYLREAAVNRRPEIVLTTANIAFLVTRLTLLLGQFNYGRQGILDRTHTRLFTFRSMRELLEQAGYDVLEVRAIPAPFPKALGNNPLSRLLLWMNRAAIALSKSLFGYQIFIRAKAKPTLATVLRDTLTGSEKLRESRPAVSV